jgi:hypothetical protein
MLDMQSKVTVFLHLKSPQDEHIQDLQIAQEVDLVDHNSPGTLSLLHMKPIACTVP